MSDERPLGSGPNLELAELWHSQQLEGKELSMEEVHGKVSTFERKIRIRNGIEYAAAVVVLFGFCYQMFEGENVYIKAGALLVMLAALFVVYFLHTRGSATDMPEELGRAASLDFYRASLVRQKDLLQSVWKWYLLPFVPGVAVMLFGAAVRDGAILNQPSPIGDRGAATSVASILIFAGIIAAFFFFIAALNKRKARKLQAELDALKES